jgi:hypothetical protein
MSFDVFAQIYDPKRKEKASFCQPRHAAAPFCGEEGTSFTSFFPLPS